MLRVLDLFAGVGGMSLGLHMAEGFETVGFCEKDPYCRRVLGKHWPEVWIHDEVKTLTGDVIQRRAGRVDLICGGPPCQPASVAGRRKGSADERWLWPDFLRVVRGCMPRWVLAENPCGIVTLKPQGLDWIISELEATGYQVQVYVAGAWAVGAPHRRDRVWIVCQADDHSSRREGQELHLLSGRSRQAVSGADGAGSGVGLANACLARLERLGTGTGSAGAQEPVPAGGNGYRWPSRPGEPQYDWEPPRLTQRRLGRNLDGFSRRVDGFRRRERLRALGNAVVPALVAEIGRAILRIEAGERVGG